MTSSLQESVCKLLREYYTSHNVTADVVCGADPDPNEPTGTFIPEKPWSPFVARIAVGKKRVQLAVSNDIWERDSTDFDTVREHLESHDWPSLIARAKSGERITFHDGGWSPD